MVTVRATRGAFGLEVMTVTGREQPDAWVRTAGAEEATPAELDADTLRAVLSARRESWGGQHQ